MGPTRLPFIVLLPHCAWPAAASAELRSVSLVGRLSFDAGTIFVSGVDSGIGGGVGLRIAFGDARAQWELGVDADPAGFVGEGDGDPLLQLAGSLSRRGYFVSAEEVRDFEKSDDSSHPALAVARQASAEQQSSAVR